MTFRTSAYVIVCLYVVSACTACSVTVINEFVFGVGAAIREVWWWGVCWDWAPMLMRSLTWDETRTTAMLFPLSLFSHCLTSFFPSSSLHLSLSFRPSSIVLSFLSHSPVLCLWLTAASCIKGKQGHLFNLLSPHTRSQRMQRIASSIHFNHLKTNQRTRLTPDTESVWQCCA